MSLYKVGFVGAGFWKQRCTVCNKKTADKFDGVFAEMAETLFCFRWLQILPQRPFAFRRHRVRVTEFHGNIQPTLFCAALQSAVAFSRQERSSWQGNPFGFVSRREDKTNKVYFSVGCPSLGRQCVHTVAAVLRKVHLSSVAYKSQKTCRNA